MAVDGTWGFVYAGETGIGIGALVVKDGRFHGTDSEINYSGTIAEDPQTGELTVDLEMDVPAGVWLVGGAGPLDMRHKRQQSFKLPPRFGELTPIELPLRPGKTLVIFKPYPDDYAAFADGFEIRPKARKGT
jgi:hypothetical protein